MENDKGKQTVDRRSFLGAAGAAAGFMIMKPQLVRGSQANSAVRVGLLGCGGRGTEDTTSIAMNGPARVVALADLFEDRLMAGKKHFDDVANKQGHAGVATSHLFQGPHAYEKILSSPEVDAVVIATPPYFHPHHLEAAVAAGKHVYCEKPVGVDVPGAKRAIEAGKKAQGRLSLDVGFQIRNAPPFAELVKRIHAGALGQITCGSAYYYCPFIKMPEWPHASPTELRLRHWLHDRVLSGDLIVEQNIHVIDICNWVLQGHPVKAIGRGSRAGRTETPGNAWSHFDVIFTYPNDVHVSFNSTQFGNGGFDANERFFGTKGSSQSPYSGTLGITGDEAWSWGGSDKTKSADFSATGSFSDNLAQADSEKHSAFIRSIVSGQYHNQAALGAESAMSAMLGRTAAYTGREATWDELIRSEEVWDPKIDIEKLG
ncbi:MAG: Gfo/Idh/MocA family oxidoreductase [Bryobacteraceae bacterium]